MRVQKLSMLALAAVILSGPTLAGASSRPSRPSGSDSITRQIVERSQAPLRFERSGDKEQLISARAALVEALADFRERDERFDLRMLGDLARAAMAATSGIEIPNWPEAGDDVDDPVQVQLHAGDLDGDGNADVVEYEFSDNFWIVARSGINGAELWRIPIVASDAFILPLGDVNGDGRDDVLIQDISVVDDASAYECLPLQTCLLGAGAAFVWKLEVRSGPDGSSVWKRESIGILEGTSSDTGEDGTYLFTGTLAAVNAVVFPLASGDHDGDGAPDLVINELDLLNPYVYALFREDGNQSAIARGFATTTRAIVLSGASGSAMSSRASATQGLAFLLPVPDMTGDGINDLLWDEDAYARPVGVCSWPIPEPDGVCLEPPVERRAIDLTDGATFLPEWNKELPGYGFIYTTNGDANGDGLEDLVFLNFTEEGANSDLISGATGETLWQSPDVVLGVVASGDQDPILSSVQTSFGFDTLDYEVRRRDGRDGSLISSTPHTIVLPTDSFDLFIFIEFWLIPDADGDGASDSFTQTTIYANETHEYLFVENGLDGSEIFVRSGVGQPYAVASKDMNGDGLSDLLDIGEQAHRRSHDLVFTGRSLPSGDAIYQNAQSVFPSSFVWLDWSDDLTGEGGTDLLLSWIQRPPDRSLESLLEVYEQSDGSIPWQVGTVLSVPPAPATGGISGTLTGQGSPFYGACVIAVNADTAEEAFAPASGDGSYEIPELDDGDYIVQFGDCFFGSFATEWYDDASDPEDATIVSVIGGGMTTGIDADLAAA